jgi:anti-sigma-K factor RskA
LTAAERDQVLEHLAACPECRLELRLYQVTTDALALASAQSTPRPEVKMSLMKRIKSRQEPVLIPARKTLKQSWRSFFIRSAPVWGFALIIVLAFGSWLLWDRLRQVNSSNPMRVVALAHTDNAPGASGTLIISQDGEYGTLVVDNLDVLDENHQYQLWLIEDGQRSSGGVFSVNSEGYASTLISALKPLNQYQAIGITVEPAGGSPGPTGAKVLGGNF